MAELKDRLRADLNDAMRSRDKVRLRTLRMALTSITNEEVAGASARDLSDEEIVKVLTREARKRRRRPRRSARPAGPSRRRPNGPRETSSPDTSPLSSATTNSRSWSPRPSPKPVRPA